MNLEHVLNEVERERRKILLLNICVKYEKNQDLETMHILRDANCSRISRVPLRFSKKEWLKSPDYSEYNYLSNCLLNAFCLGGDFLEDTMKFLKDKLNYCDEESMLTVERGLKLFVEKDIVSPEKPYFSIEPLPEEYFELFKTFLTSGYQTVRQEMAEIIYIMLYRINVDPIIRPLKDVGLEFIRTYAKDMQSVKSEKELLDELMKLVQTREIDYRNLMEIYKAKKIKDFAEMFECAQINLPDHIVLARLGSGSFKTAYLGKSKHKNEKNDETILLKIAPQEQGLIHIQLVHPDLKGCSYEQILEKIKKIEFLATKLTTVKHPNVALMFDPISGTIGGNEFFFIPMKERYNKTLEDELKEGRLPPARALKYFYQICCGLDACHAEGITHKDLKYGNIGITKEDNVLLSDFGCVGAFSEGSNCAYHHPLQLRPPELARMPEEFKPGEQARLMNMPEVNVWGAGAILYRMLTGEDIVQRPAERGYPGTDLYKKQNEQVCVQISALTEPDIAKKIEDARIDKRCGDLVKMCLRTNINDRKGVLKECIAKCEEIMALY